MPTAIAPRKVLLLEINEITWTILDPLVKAGKLPAFARVLSEGARSAPDAIERPPHLDPWISWVTLHTGVERGVHGAAVLGQDDIHAKRTWDYVVDAGKSIGVFGSISAYPPRPVPGFMVPGPFSPTSDTYPAFLSPALDLNRRYTQVHLKTEEQGGLLEMAERVRDLVSLGLQPSTCLKVVEQLAREKIDPHSHWRRVGLQPQINFDFFKALYTKYRPDFATWHTGHCAHYMHHYWRAWDDSKFRQPASPDEKRHFGGAVEYGYRLADELLGRFMRMIDDRTVIAVASGLGMQPYVADLYPKGKICLRMKSPRQILDLVGARGVTEVVPAMTPQWNIRIPRAEDRAQARLLLEKAYATGNVRPQAFHVAETGELLTVTPIALASADSEVRYFFPDAPNAREAGYEMSELFAADAPTPKEAMHHPQFVFTLWGDGIRPGADIPDTTALDIAPTLLALMGIPVPSIMTGRVLSEAWGDRPVAAAERPAPAQIHA